MADKNILHMLTPTKLTSPFDVNVALDAGYDAVRGAGGQCVTWSIPKTRP